MSFRIKILFCSALAVFSFVFFARDAHAVVPTWDVGLSGPAPSISILGDAGWDKGKEISIFSLSDFTSLEGIINAAKNFGKSMVTKLIPSWDGIAKYLAHAVLVQVRNSMVDWISSGFEGSPSFIDNPEDFLSGVGNIAASDFVNRLSADITGDPNFLCGNLGNVFPKIMFQYAVPRNYTTRFKCDISGIQENLARFSNDFSVGGFDRLLEVRQSNNNFFGVYWGVLDEIDRRYQAAYQSRLQEANWSGGFLSTQECAEVAKVPDDYVGQPPCLKYVTITPGKTIGDRVASVIGSDVQEIVQADEVSEVIQLLVDLAINQALSQGLAKASSLTSDSNRYKKADKFEFPGM